MNVVSVNYRTTCINISLAYHDLYVNKICRFCEQYRKFKRESQTCSSELCNVFPKFHSERMLLEPLCEAVVVTKGNFDLRGHLAIPEPSVNGTIGSEALDI